MTEVKNTQYGFEWGPVDVSRVCSDTNKGWVTLTLKTKKHPIGVQIYVTKTGKLRIFSGSAEWTISCTENSWEVSQV